MAAHAPARASSAVWLFDAHYLLQDPHIAAVAPALIRGAVASGVARLAVNGTSEVALKAEQKGRQASRVEREEERREGVEERAKRRWRARLRKPAEGTIWSLFT